MTNRKQTRVNDRLARDIDDYEDEHAHLNESEAMRELLRAGLDAKATEDEQDVKTIVERLASPPVIVTGLVMYLVAALLVATAGLLIQSGALLVGLITAGAALVFVTTAAVTTWLAALALIALGEPLRSLLPQPPWKVTD